MLGALLLMVGLWLAIGEVHDRPPRRPRTAPVPAAVALPLPMLSCDCGSCCSACGHDPACVRYSTPVTGPAGAPAEGTFLDYLTGGAR